MEIYGCQYKCSHKCVLAMATNNELPKNCPFGLCEPIWEKVHER